MIPKIRFMLDQLLGHSIGKRMQFIERC